MNIEEIAHKFHETILKECVKPQKTEEKNYIFATIRFCNKDVKRMPKEFRTQFKACGCVAVVRKYFSLFGLVFYEINYNRNGYNVAVGGNDLYETKEKFIETLNNQF